jgi:hypothetical protein
VAFSLSAALSGGLSGSALGLVGNYVPLHLRLAVAVIAGLVFVGIGLAELTDRIGMPLQCSRETPREWSRYGPVPWAIVNGLALGNGFSTRVGFWSWSLIPLSAFLVGSWPASTAIYGLYGASRGGGLWLIVLLSQWFTERDWSTWLVRQVHPARRLSGAVSMAVGLVVFVTVGL